MGQTFLEQRLFARANAAGARSVARGDVQDHLKGGRQFGAVPWGGHEVGQHPRALFRGNPLVAMANR